MIEARCLCAIPSRHRLAAAETVRIRDLDSEPMGGLTREHPHNQRLMRAFGQAGARFRLDVQCQFFLPLMHFIAAGRCCAIVDPLSAVTEQLVGIAGDGVTFRPLEERIPYAYTLYTPVHRPLSKLAQRVKSGWRAELTRLLGPLESSGLAG